MSHYEDAYDVLHMDQQQRDRLQKERKANLVECLSTARMIEILFESHINKMSYMEFDQLYNKEMGNETKR